jgi:hypothetical protein
MKKMRDTSVRGWGISHTHENQILVNEVTIIFYSRKAGLKVLLSPKTIVFYGLEV